MKKYVSQSVLIDGSLCFEPRVSAQKSGRKKFNKFEAVRQLILR